MDTQGITDPAVEDAIERLFMVEDMYLDRDLPTFVVKPIGAGDQRQLLKDEFRQLARDLKPLTTSLNSKRWPIASASSS